MRSPDEPRAGRLPCGRIAGEPVPCPGRTQSAEDLFKIRLREPAALEHVERLCLLDLVRVSSVRLLHRLYTETGDLNDAERIARFAVEQLGQRFDHKLVETRSRLAALEAEDA